LGDGLANDSGYVVFEYVSQKLINDLREKLKRQGLEVRTTDDRKGYVPMANRLSRESDPDKILAFAILL
jgi:hypothetical protein